MNVGWIADEHEPKGGAELTQAEFRAATPKGVTVRDVMNRGPIPADIETFVVHNHQTYDQLPGFGKKVRYVHDMRGIGEGMDAVIFCSPMQQEAYGREGHMIPPALDYKALTPPRQTRRNTKRNGTCCVGAFLNPGKGGHLVSEWADENEPVDFYGWGAYQPVGPNIRNRGPLESRLVPQMLWQYERFIFLPTALEPFGRSVAEAWAAGCDVITNDLVGARYWIEEEPDKLKSAAEAFWRVVTDA